MLINISFITFVLLIIFVFLLYFQYTVYSYILITILILIQVLRLDKKLLMYYYKKYINILDKELDPEKFIEITQNEYDRNKNRRYRNYMKLNLCAGYSSLGKVEEAYQNLKDIDLSKKSLFRAQDKILYYYNEVLLLHGLERKEEAIVIYQEKVLKMMEKFKTKKGLDETNAMIKFLNGILFYENDTIKMIEILSKTLKKLSVKRQGLVIKHLLANYKSKAGEMEEARKLYEEVIENGNKLYIVEEAKEKLNKLVNNEN